MLSLITFLALVSILALIHEFGHFIAAKLSGVKVEEFGIGFPPRLLGIRKGETAYSLNALPLGGFVRLLGEEGESESPRAFCNQPLSQQGFIVSAGVLMNFFLGLALLMVTFAGFGVPRGFVKLQVESIDLHSAADGSRLQVGDSIVGYGKPGQKVEYIYSAQEFNSFLKDNLGKKISLRVDPPVDDRSHKLVVVTLPTQPSEEGKILGIDDLASPHISFFPLSPLKAPELAVRQSWIMMKGVFPSIKELFLRLFTARPTPEHVAGPIGIARASGVVAELGWAPLLYFAATLSVSLAVFNILPLPALDGGRLMFVLIELLAGKKIDPRFQYWINAAGFAFLILLMIWVTAWDVIRIF